MRQWWQLNLQLLSSPQALVWQWSQSNHINHADEMNIKRFPVSNTKLLSHWLFVWRIDDGGFETSVNDQFPQQRQYSLSFQPVIFPSSGFYGFPHSRFSGWINTRVWIQCDSSGDRLLSSMQKRHHAADRANDQLGGMTVYPSSKCMVFPYSGFCGLRQSRFFRMN